MVENCCFEVESFSYSCVEEKRGSNRELAKALVLCLAYSMLSIWLYYIFAVSEFFEK